MVQKSNVLKQFLKHKGIFNYVEVYAFCYEWLVNEGYKVSETLYQEKVTEAKDVVIEWVARKDVSDYFRNVMKLNWHLIRMSDVEIEKDGKKVKTNRGDFEIKFTVDLERDYEGRWEERPFWKFFHSIYDKYIARTTIEEYEDRLTDKAIEYIEQIKSFLELEGKRK